VAIWVPANRKYRATVTGQSQGDEPIRRRQFIDVQPLWIGGRPTVDELTPRRTSRGHSDHPLTGKTVAGTPRTACGR
jgi:hypothetical protein